MPRFFSAGGTVAGGVAFITGEDAAHARVLRLRVGDTLIVCDGTGRDHRCRVTKMSQDGLEAEVLETVASAAEPDLRVTVLAGFPKGERADYIVQKCTELGAAEIVFFLCERCVARPDTAAVGRKVTRFQRIAEAAAKQAGRGAVPIVRAVEDLGAALDIAAKAQLALFMYETGERLPLRAAIEGAGDIRTAAIVTGPEGGFEEYEAQLAGYAGLTRCSMGPRILRCETAPIAALAALLYATGNMD